MIKPLKLRALAAAKRLVQDMPELDPMVDASAVAEDLQKIEDKINEIVIVLKKIDGADEGPN